MQLVIQAIREYVQECEEEDRKGCGIPHLHFSEQYSLPFFTISQ